MSTLTTHTPVVDAFAAFNNTETRVAKAFVGGLSGMAILGGRIVGGAFVLKVRIGQHTQDCTGATLVEALGAVERLHSTHTVDFTAQEAA